MSPGGAGGEPPSHWALADPSRVALQNAPPVQSTYRLRASPEGGSKSAQPGVYSGRTRYRLWGDITYLPTGEGWLYLAVVLDLCSRAVVGWSMADHMRAELVNQALAMAICQRQPVAGLIMHTDRGSQYGADSSQQLLTQHGIQPSLSRKGNCWDNAVAESFFHTLKTE